MKRVSEAPEKKPYQAPKLIVYGDLTQLTMATMAGKGRPDGTKNKRT